MKNFLYQIVKTIIRVALHLYFGKIIVKGLKNVPKDKPVLFLPNHQNALLDALLIVINCNRKPFFLTRSDVFKNNILKTIFKLFQMLPIYRIRDGRDSLKNNQAVFESCKTLLKNKESLLMFPEANHNLQRRVRPLSKGFTRILFSTLEAHPELDIQIVPVGLNYKKMVAFPDTAAIFYGEPIAAKEYYNSENVNASVVALKELVSARIQKLTTHIASEENYEVIEKQLDALGVDYMQPEAVNKTIASIELGAIESSKSSSSMTAVFLRSVFWLLNFPVLILWKLLVKPKIWEPEFSATLRFGFSFVIYPMYYGVIFALLTFLATPLVALFTVVGIFIFNWIYVRLGN